MKEEELRERNSPELEWRRWYDGELAVEDPISPGISGRGAAEAARKVKMQSVGEQ
jgi:hypothetical protein